MDSQCLHINLKTWECFNAIWEYIGSNWPAINFVYFGISPLDTSQKADGRRIHDYLPTSVLVACLCFYMPTGLLAVRYAHKVPTENCNLQYRKFKFTVQCYLSTHSTYSREIGRYSYITFRIWSKSLFPLCLQIFYPNKTLYSTGNTGMYSLVYRW